MAITAFVLFISLSLIIIPAADAFAFGPSSSRPSQSAAAHGTSSSTSYTSSSSLSALLTAGDTTVPATVNFGPEGPSGLSGVRNIVAVSSCKGGVGKSTTSVNLAYSLRALGYKVGIFDADLFGPSLPTMITPDDDNVRFIERQIAPLENNGVKLMSFGYVNNGSAIMRGPMVTQLLDQFLSMVHWGELDYLILDMPPGTGDVQLTLTQRLDITAAVVVTTPQQLSFVDVERGVEMFNTVNVPCISVVENMAYIEPTTLQVADDSDTGADADDSSSETTDMDMNNLAEAFIQELMASSGDVISTETDEDMEQIEQLAERLVDIVEKSKIGGETGTSSSSGGNDASPERIQIFGKGHKERLAKSFGIENTFSVPLLDTIASHGDSGKPYVFENPTSNVSRIYKSLAETVVSEVAKLAEMAITRPSVRYDDKEHVITVMDVQPLENEEQNKEEGDEAAEAEIDVTRVPPAELRRDCRCAACVEELTNKQLLDPASVPDSVHPVGELERYGNYAVSVNWSDGHKSLYPYRQIRELVRDVKDGKTVAESKKEKVL